MWYVPTLGDTWPEVSTTLPEDSVWSIMTEVVLACWNLCLLRRVIVLWNDENYFSLLLTSLDWTDGNHHGEDTRDIDNNPVLSICFQIVSLSISGSFVLYLEITEAYQGLTGNVSQYYHHTTFFDNRMNSRFLDDFIFKEELVVKRWWWCRL